MPLIIGCLQSAPRLKLKAKVPGKSRCGNYARIMTLLFGRNLWMGRSGLFWVIWTLMWLL